jgi:hypothetical protein
MTAVGGTRVRHYRDIAFMGFVPVLLHLRSIFSNMSMCKKDIVAWNPDVLILVDYPGFNLSIAEYIHKNTDIPQWNIADIEGDATQCGLTGSPTRVKTIESIVLKAKESRVMGSSDEEIEYLMRELIE